MKDYGSLSPNLTVVYLKTLCVCKSGIVGYMTHWDPSVIFLTDVPYGRGP